MEHQKKIAFVGSVDHGKSSCIGHILYLTGNVDEREFQKTVNTAQSNKMERWKFAYLLDIYDEERARGKTLDYNMVKFTWEDEEYEFIDNPGHLHYVRNMIAGASQANVGVLLCSVSLGEFESGLAGQTKEHLIILRGMGIRTLIVLMNKMDARDYSENIFREHVKQLQQRILNSLRFSQVYFIPISGYQGDNLLSLSTKMPWYTDLPFMPRLTNLKETDLKLSKPPVPIRERTLSSTNGSMQYIMGQIMFLEIPSLISKGFKGILHTDTEHYEVIVDALFDPKSRSKKAFVKSREQCLVRFRFHNQLERDKLLSPNIVLRDGNISLGIGVLRAFIK